MQLAGLPCQFPAVLPVFRATDRLRGILRRRNRVRIERRTPSFPISSSGRRDAVVGPLGDGRCLEFPHRAEELEQEFADRRGDIEAFLEADHVDAAGLETVDGFEQFPECASQSVEPGDALSVAGSGVLDEMGDSGAVRVIPRSDIGEDADGAGLAAIVSVTIARARARI